MSKRVALPVLVSVALGVGALAQTTGSQSATRQSQAAGRSTQSSAPTPPVLSPEQRWVRANDGWNAGKYSDALRDFKTLMQGASAAAYHDRIALLTGELFTTTEITTDGRNPKISPNGQFVAYEAGPPGQVVTRVVRVATGAPQQVAELKGVRAAFDNLATRVVYLRGTQNAEWQTAVTALEDADTNQDRQAAQALVDFLLGKGELVVRDLAAGTERILPTPGLLKTAPLFTADGRVIFIGSETSDLARSDIYLSSDGAAPVRLTDQPGHKGNVQVDASGAALVYAVTGTAPFRQPAAPGAARGGGAAGGRGGGGAGGGRGAGGAGGGAPGAAPTPNPCGSGGGGGRGGGGATASFGIVDLRNKTTRIGTGTGVTMSADGSTLAWLSRNADVCNLQVSPTLTDGPKTARAGVRIDAPALSPDGKLVAYQMMPSVGSSTDWEIFITDETGAHRRLTRDIQHDLLPRFLSNTTVLGLIGEARHRRSYLYDVGSGARTRVFANNTVRTVSPEYIWLPNANGTRLLIQADRDGDTVSTERGVSVVDLSRPITAAELTARLDRQLAAETDLRQRMTAAFQPIDALVKRVVASPAASRVYECQKTQFDFDSKHVSRPGNAKAIAYLEKAYASFGYAPELQWFQPQQAQGNRTANIVATLKGTVNPELIYVVSSHFDSVAGGPGADDDTSGTCALLETARALASTPLAATVVFASFTGEEAGLLGSREFVRLAAQNKWNVAGALNNDMIGWAGESGRMDNTIRYSNAGIRDIQHGAAFLYTDLILYDSKYYRSTDAAAFYEAWGDIVGGIGSYPILSNPNYHQATDLLETINFQQVAETAKVTAATLVYLASSPSRLQDLKATKAGAGVRVTWTPSPEKGVAKYIVSYGPAADLSKATRLTVTTASASLPALPAGTLISVKAVNTRGLEGWDWARTVLQ